jgi:DNA-binding LytR/AlgR family response regulator
MGRGGAFVHIAIVEDDSNTRKELVKYFDRYFEQDAHRYSIDEYVDGDEILESYNASYDLILLDIQMTRLDGLKTAEKIRQLDENVYLVFVTNLANYAIRGYSVNALDFVLKPVNYLMLRQLLQRVEKLLDKRNKRFITLPTDQGLARLEVAQIDYVETEGHIMAIHTQKGVYRLRDTMKNMERKLSDYGFYRCNNCYLVNLARLEKVDHSCVIVSGQTLSISRPRYKGFMDALTAYIGEAKV